MDSDAQRGECYVQQCIVGVHPGDEYLSDSGGSRCERRTAFFCHGGLRDFSGEGGSGEGADSLEKYRDCDPA